MNPLVLLFILILLCILALVWMWLVKRLTQQRAQMDRRLSGMPETNTSLKTPHPLDPVSTPESAPAEPASSAAASSTPTTVDASSATEDAALSAVPNHQAAAPNGARRSILPAKAFSLDARLFLLALLVFVLTRFIGLDRWPVYFFTDEAVQTVQAANLVQHGFHDAKGTLFPTYFANGTYLNLSVSVYAQVIPYLLFGYSEFITRAVSALIALSGVAAVGLMLRDIFKIRFWWAGALLLTITPAWFLHSRTAFETAIGTAFYAWFLYFYLLYRYRSPRYIFAAVIFGALSFYAYSPAQVVVVLSGLLLLLSDFRFHWQTLRSRPWIILAAAVLLVSVALPYLRFQAEHPAESYYHLRILNSYWLQNDLTPAQKIEQFWQQYTYAISPAYWYSPTNDSDLIRHIMKGYGNLLLITLPFALIGLALCIRKIKSAAHRVTLIATAVTPIGSALVQPVQVYRELAFVVPTALMTALGLVFVLAWPLKRINYRWLAMGCWAILSATGAAMTYDALVNGPFWYNNYGLYGLQYGGPQIFEAARDYLQHSPNTQILVSPTWANGTDLLMNFFMPNEWRVQMGNIDAFKYSQLPLPENLLFIMTADEYRHTLDDPKFTDLRQARPPLQYPDGTDGFYFVQLHYSPQAAAIFAAEKAARRQPVKENWTIDGETVGTVHSQFGAGEIKNLFDGDAFTLIRTLVDNPFYIELTFPQPHPFTGVTVTTGTMDFNLTVKTFTAENAAPQVYSQTYTGRGADPTVTLKFDPLPGMVHKIRIEVKDIKAGEEAKIHVREIVLNR